VENPEGRRPLDRPRRRWVDNIFILEGVDWIDVTQYREKSLAVVRMVMNLLSFVKYGKFLD
jgi:hypothetical protein